jgi:hypothetical protein
LYILFTGERVNFVLKRDDRTVWPSEKGKFNFNNFMDGTAFFVMGSNKESENVPGKCLS